MLILLFYLLGISGISAGLAMIAAPYGIIAAGAGLVLLAIILAIGQDDGGSSRRNK